MKIKFITPFFYPVEGGMEKHVLYLSEELIKLGHKIEVITSNLSREGKLEKTDEIYKKIKIKRLSTWFKIGDLSSFFPGFFKEVKKSDADIIHIHAYRHPHNLACLITKKPTLITTHWPEYKGLRKKWLDIFIILFDKTLGKFLINKYDRVIAVAKPEVKWLENKFKIRKEKIELIPNGIPKEQLKQFNGNNFRKKYNFKLNELLILYFGRLHKSKGVDQIIKISKYFPNVKFIIMGNGPELNNLKSEGRNIKNIKFIYGKITDKEKMEAFNAADIFIHPSHYDAFGITLLEAFSQKCAVITTNQGGLPWVVEKAGLIFKDNDLNDLKEKLSLLINNNKLRLELQEKGYKKVKNFTWDKIARKLELVYKELLNKKI